ncbi:hypothetical protein [Verminephrobacter aporrectodeae]|nr:hypothetical protein [Verminephrobacter aporrectodeae]MCW8164299.1 hypothetical protein [Verminephrobacter aporrectodeae subsp. tuberculatae]MCW8168554.1 hypothetical protein [Verminephrobacter aporrectodeae subsp. tuberculatae]MCW8174654.1 hypothetical protein [Verminephrobacter aporrectodeae subsp. tuberculatae]MCW8201244.1 hypothetical protein [Verminephrobacter aporrectodeae subsp. tuberculatae]
MSRDNDTVPPTAETANASAIASALGALVFATVRQLPTQSQTAFATDLARLARNAERQGQTPEEALLLNLYRVAVAAAK